MHRGEAKSLAAKMPIRKGKRVAFFRELPINKQGFLLHVLAPMQQHQILTELHNKEIIALLHYLDPDEVTTILHNVSHHRRLEIIEELSEDIKEKVEFLLKFNPKSAAGMMSLDYVEVERSMTFGKISKIIKHHERLTGKFPAILVVQEGFLVGELPGHSLVHHRSAEKVSNHVRHVPHIRFDSDHRQVVGMFKSHPHDKIVVLDDQNSILGVIYSDDILRLIESQEGVSLLDFAGVSQEEDVYDNAFVKLWHRNGWLLLNMLLALCAAFVVKMFAETISAFVLLAAYMPVVAAIGGSAGTQTLAVVVRGMALHEIKPKHIAHLVSQEMIAGALNGLIIGCGVAIISMLWNQDPWFALVIATAMFISLMCAAFFGAIIPFIIKYFGKDPASSATVFITTATDVCGFFFFLWFASILL